LTLDYENAAVERDEARDWCRKLVAIVKAFQKHRHLNRCVEYAAITGKPFCIAECADGYAAIARALPPELRAEIEEAK
jgi:hypothetical protein